MDLIQSFTSTPIREAVIDIQMPFLPEASIKHLGALNEDMFALFPIKSEINQHTVGLDNQEQSVNHTQAFIGYKYMSEDNKDILQLRNNGFTLSRLSPYTGWDTFIALAEKLWKEYVKLARLDNASANRVAARYINIISVPTPLNDFADYLTSPPIIPDLLPQILGQFFSRIALPFGEKNDYNAIITQTIDSAENTHVNLLLDIDVFKEKNIPFSQIWEELASIRKIKNDIFSKSITEKTKKIYL